MNNDGILKEEDISNIILCEPITRKGKEALAELGLTTEDVSPKFFYDKLRVESKYDKKRVYFQKMPEQNQSHNVLYYQYTVNYLRHKELSEQWEKFDTRFYSNSPNEYPLLMLGVAGNGKSIEINRRINEILPMA